LRPGDTFEIVLTSERASDGEQRVGGVVLAGLERKGRVLVQNLRANANSGNPPSVSGPPRAGAFGWPVSGRLTSSYGFRRHPLLGFLRMHAGVDIAAPAGSPIIAPAAGTVSRAGRHGGYGNYVRLDHGSAHSTAYGHLSGISVSPGQTVRPGQVIGWVGSSGLATGPHLHFEVLRNGRPTDPSEFHPHTNRPAPNTSEQEDVQAKIAELRALPLSSGIATRQ
jgi:murein DD-endopeptidase MepM/ murein hydrolase activator NlpD